MSKTTLFALPFLFLLSGCIMGPDGNSFISEPDSIERQSNLMLNTGAYINQCYENGFYDQETHDDMLNGWINSKIKETGKNPVITTFNQSVDFDGCNYLIMNFDNYRVIPHIDSKGRIRSAIKKENNK